MNLYKIEKADKTKKLGYQSYHTAIVAAFSVAEAKLIHPSDFYFWENDKKEWGDQNGNISVDNGWVKPDEVRVTSIGKADKNIQQGVILSAFSCR